MSEDNNLEKHDEEEFNLYTENIVLKKSVKYRKVIHVGKLMLEAIVFGSIACFAFVALYPWMSNQFPSDGSKMIISIPKDEYPEGTEESPTQDILGQQSEIATADFQNTFQLLSETMVETKKSIVTISAVYNETSDFLSEDKNIGDTSGLIIAASDTKFTILTSYNVMKNAKSINVLFNNGNSMPAYVLSVDADTGIAVICVTLSEETDIDRSNISAAVLDNSYQIGQGDIVFVAGKLLGNNSSVNYGTAINVKTSKSGIDSYYSLISTNLQQYNGDYGYLFNSDGNVVGIMKSDSVDNQNGELIAYGISDLKALIEKMSNAEDVTYLGVTGTTITNSIATTYNLPMGIYVTGVVENSPAFSAGLMNGDIITAVSGQTVVTFKSLCDSIYKYNNGDSIILNVKRKLGKDDYKIFSFNVTLGKK